MNHRLFGRPPRGLPSGRTGISVSEIVFGGGNVGGILIHQDGAAL